MSAKYPTGWNYRLYHHDDTVELVEVYYGPKGTIYGWCQATLVQDTRHELREDITSMLAAFRLPVLTVSDMPQEALR